MRGPVLVLIYAYRWLISPLKFTFFGPGGRCRFEPTCSEYALEGVRRHGAWRGGVLALRRLARCHPWGGCGCDPVPPAPLLDRAARSASPLVSGLESRGSVPSAGLH